jgi:hypothetical protein
MTKNTVFFLFTTKGRFKVTGDKFQVIQSLWFTAQVSIELDLTRVGALLSVQSKYKREQIH